MGTEKPTAISQVLQPHLEQGLGDKNMQLLSHQCDDHNPAHCTCVQGLISARNSVLLVPRSVLQHHSCFQTFLILRKVWSCMGTPLCSEKNCDMYRLWYSTTKLCSEHDLHLCPQKACIYNLHCITTSRQSASAMSPGSRGGWLATPSKVNICYRELPLRPAPVY